MKDKPPVGEPCNNCGGCCKASLCPLGEVIFGRSVGPCPGLESCDNETFVCGLVVNPQNYRPVRTFAIGREIMSTAAALLVGAGIGCDALVGSEDTPQARREMKARWKRLGYVPESRAVKAALRIWHV